MALLIVVGALNAWEIERVYRANSIVSHTYVVQDRLRQLLARLVDAETGQRGFIITGAPRYLEPYEAALEAEARDMEDLRRLTADNPAQQADLTTLDGITRAKLDELRTTIRLRQEIGFDAARERVLSDAGKRAMDEARGVVARMVARESALLATRTDQARRNYHVALATGIASTASALVAFTALFISVRRRAAERHRALMAIAAEREYLEVTLLGIGDGVIVSDPQGRVALMNPTAEALTGRRMKDAVGRPIPDVFTIVNEQTREVVENPASRAIATGALQGLANHTVLISSDGTERAIDDSGAPIRNPDGEIVGAVLVFRDVSEQRRSAAALEAALHEAHEVRARLEAQEVELRNAARAKDEFLAVVSHELRTPINAVVGWANMLQTGSVREDRIGAAVASIDRNARSLARMIEDLLDTSRLFTGKRHLSFSDVDVCALTLNAIDSVRVSADDKSVTLATDIPAQLPPVWGDGERLNQIVWNLLVNAIKFTPSGGRIDVRLSATGAALQLEVRDTGVGIDPAFLPHIFERFRQADTSHARSGLGLGLTIAYRLVQLHGGTIEARSDGLGRGATFVVTLPTKSGTDAPPI